MNVQLFGRTVAYTYWDPAWKNYQQNWMFFGTSSTLKMVLWKKKNTLSNSPVADVVYKNFEQQWDYAGIPTQWKNKVKEKILKLHEEYRSVQKRKWKSSNAQKGAVICWKSRSVVFNQCERYALVRTKFFSVRMSFMVRMSANKNFIVFSLYN